MTELELTAGAPQTGSDARRDGSVPLDIINSATKYPSIPTYHALGERGRLTEALNVDFREEPEIVVTEKIDGTNARIVLGPAVPGGRGWLIGSREELLHARGDLIANPALGIVETLTASVRGRSCRGARVASRDDHVHPGASRSRRRAP